MKPVTRFLVRPPFTFGVKGDDKSRLIRCAGSEWYLFREFRRLSREGAEIAWFESADHPLTDRSLAALNCYLRTRAMRFWRSERWDGDRELIGWGEWNQFCSMLGLKFEGAKTRFAA